MVLTDASNLGWGALHEGMPASGLWSSTEQSLHINCLEMKAVGLALKAFLSNLRGHHVLVRTDNMSVVAYINRQGGIRSGNLHAMARDLLLWAQTNLSSLRAAHIPGVQNVGADMLSRGNTPLGEWSLNPQTVSLIWKVFGEAEIDLFASKSNTHCKLFFSKNRDALAHVWPNRPLYAFPPVSMIPQVIKRVRESGCPVLLVAPLWKTRPWFPELVQLSDTSPWPVPLRKDLLTQANGTLWHPRPDLWALHVWPLNGYRRPFLRRS